MHVIPDQLPWWVAGPGVGLCVVALYALAGVRLGVSSGSLQLVFLAQGRRATESWRLWFTGALVVGAFLAPALGAGRVSGYGDLSDYLSVPALVVVLVLTGVLIGYGARWPVAAPPATGSPDAPPGRRRASPRRPRSSWSRSPSPSANTC